MITDQQWRDLDLLPSQPPKPRYDAFEIFKPSKAFLKEVIKELNHAAFSNLKYIRELRNEPGGDIFIPFWEAENEKLNRRVRDYQYRLRPVSKNSGTSITSQDILRAKEQTIEVYYTGGKLRRTGKDLVGRCCLPGHQDNNPSFTIYNDGRKFKCFSCNESGDTIDFIRKTKALGFIQSIKFILNLK